MTAATRDRGSASVWAIAVMALVFAVASTAMGVEAAVVARHRASSAADLAALAAAGELARGGPDPCGAAARIARAQGGVVSACALDGLTADVLVRLPVTGPLSFGLDAVMRARAGPASEGR